MTALIVTLVATLAIGLLLRLRDGTFRAAAPALAGGAPDTVSVAGLGRRATLLQISAEACAVCPRVARVLTELADTTAGVHHVELRAEEHPDLLERFDVRRSPTVLVLDRTGRVVARASGAVTADQAREALATLTPLEDLR